MVLLVLECVMGCMGFKERHQLKDMLISKTYYERLPESIFLQCYIDGNIPVAPFHKAGIIKNFVFKRGYTWKKYILDRFG